MSAASQEDLDNWYAYHPPTVDQVNVYTEIRAKAKELGELFNGYAPRCADSTAAHRKLRDAVMAMNLAIACNPAQPADGGAPGGHWVMGDRVPPISGE